MSKVSEYNALVGRHRDTADFVTVYVMEAHARDSLWPDPQDYDVKSHLSLPDRLCAARRLGEVGVAGQMLVDSMEDQAALVLGAVPERLMVVRQGVVTYLGEFGPRGYNIAEVEEHLNTYTG